VRDVVVVAREDVKGERKLVGYVVPEGNGFENHSLVLRTFLKERLPDYMVPVAFVLIESLPLTASGKIDRRALVALVPGEVESVHRYEPPRDAQEEKLAEIWAAVLRRKRVGIRDNFFELGGHSLMATQLVSRVRSAFEVELPLRNLFESPTVAELAGIIVQLQTEMKTLPSSTIIRHTSDDASELLTKLDQLSDADVDSLLREAMVDSENNE
jgi:acyl carrier protein